MAKRRTPLFGGLTPRFPVFHEIAESHFKSFTLFYMKIRLNNVAAQVISRPSMNV